MHVEDLPVAVLTVDRDLVITEANPAALTLLKGKRKELVGEQCASALRPRSVAGEDLLAGGWPKSTWLRGTRALSEQRVLVKRLDGTELEVLVDGGYLRNDAGELRGATFLLRSRQRAGRRPRSGVRIVAAVSHELRSPLTSIRGYTSLLLKRWDVVSDEDRKAMLRQVDQDARRVGRMINELLDISRIETGRVQLNRRETGLESLAGEVIGKVRMGYPDLEASVAFPTDMPLIWADADKVEQVLTNLLENACKYASAKGLVIEGSWNEDWVAVKVKDVGPGIPARDLSRLFQQFFKSRDGRPTGTGLGLWISRGLIEAHGGTMTAQSDGQHGSTFCFELPRKSFEEIHDLGAERAGKVRQG